MRSLNNAGNVKSANKTVVDDNTLRSVIALAFYGKDLNFLNKLSKEQLILGVVFSVRVVSILSAGYFRELF